MPTTKDFKNHKKNSDKNADKKSDSKKAHKAEASSSKIGKEGFVRAGADSKRRPGRETESEPVQETLKFQDAYVTQEPNQEKLAEERKRMAAGNEPLVEAVAVPLAETAVDAGVDAPTETIHHRGGSDEDLATLEKEAEEPSDAPKIEIRFSGSELLRSRFPTPFALAEVVATDWVFGGEFDKLPINQPLAKFAAQQGLLKAKEIEKRVMESPAVEKAAIQVLTVGMKAQGFISELREKLRKP